MMSKSYIYRLSRLLFAASLTLQLTGCNDDMVVADDDQRVLFTTSLPGQMTTRSAKDDYQTRMGAYKAVSEAYEFTVGMYQAGSLIGESLYHPVAGGMQER